MDSRKRKLPIGIDDFGKLIREEFYYVDKTGMIEELLHNWGEVNLFARPRRFGKSLNMSMLQYFFEVGTDRHLFDGLIISEDAELCEEWMGQYPVISLTLKDAWGIDYQDAMKQMAATISYEVVSNREAGKGRLDIVAYRCKEKYALITESDTEE